MRIIFMGTPEYAKDILAGLFDADLNVVAVFTQPDKPVGRKQILTPSSVKNFICQNYPNVPIFQPKTLKNDEIKEQIISLNPNFIIVGAYGQILPKDILSIAPCINLHASILPKYRGASPIQSALLNDEIQTGVTSMLMDIGLDTGDMLEFGYTECKNKTSKELFNELGKIAANLAVSTIKNFSKITPQKQDEHKATYCKKITKDMGLFNFNQSVKEIYNKFRALTPWPGIFLQSGLKILSLEPMDKMGKNGEILEIAKDGFIVGCDDGSIKIKMLQEPGKKALNAYEYINGKRLGVGSRIY